MFLFKKSTLLILGLLLMLTACGGGGGGGSDSVNYSLNYSDISLNYSDYTGPYLQAIEFSRNLVTENDTSTFTGVIYSGQVDWVMADSRSDIDNVVLAYEFLASYSDGYSVQIFVNPEFGDPTTAEAVATNYAEVIGRIPVFLRDGIYNDLSFLYIHQGFESLMGNQNYLVIYTGRAAELYGYGILEETLIHESVHVSLDYDLDGPNFSDWLSAQSNDGNAVSQLAYDLVDEDVAETLLAYIAVQYRANRLSASVEDTILATIPNRIDYLNTRGFDMSPIVQDLPGDWDNASAPVSSWQHPSLFAYYEQWEQTVILF